MPSDAAAGAAAGAAAAAAAVAGGVALHAWREAQQQTRWWQHCCCRCWQQLHAEPITAGNPQAFNACMCRQLLVVQQATHAPHAFICFPEASFPPCCRSLLLRATSLQIEFTQLIVDECQQIGSINSKLYSLLCAVRVQQRLLMSGAGDEPCYKPPSSC
jgi:hypothetical protein